MRFALKPRMTHILNCPLTARFGAGEPEGREQCCWPSGEVCEAKPPETTRPPRPPKTPRCGKRTPFLGWLNLKRYNSTGSLDGLASSIPHRSSCFGVLPHPKLKKGSGGLTTRPTIPCHRFARKSRDWDPAVGRLLDRRSPSPKGPGLHNLQQGANNCQQPKPPKNHASAPSQPPSASGLNSRHPFA